MEIVANRADLYSPALADQMNATSRVAATSAMAVASPLLLTYTPNPTTAFFKDALGLLCWGLLFVLLACRGTPEPEARPGRGVYALIGSLALMIVAAAASVWFTAALPGLAAADALGLAAAATAVLAGSRVGRLASALGNSSRGDLSSAAVTGLYSGLALAALLNAMVAVGQVHAPSGLRALGLGIEGVAGSNRAIGLVHQSNILATLMVWGVGALVALTERGQMRCRFLSAGGAVLMLGAVVTESRTGVLCVLLLVAWALIDRGLLVSTRRALAAMPVLYAAAWAIASLLAYAGLDAGDFATDDSGVRAGLGSPRWAMWRQSLGLISEQPWLGVGWGNFNFAWTLTPMVRLTTEQYTHAHNVLLHWSVEMGLPLTLLVMSLVGYAAVRAIGGIRHSSGPAHAMRAAAMLIVAAGAVHSLTEYPLWYAHLLLPFAFSFGLALSGESTGRHGTSGWILRTPLHSTQSRHEGRRVVLSQRHNHWQSAGMPPAMALAGWTIVAATLIGTRSYMPTLELLRPSDPMAAIEDRVAAAQESWFFPQWGLRFRATLAPSGKRSLEPFDRGAVRRMLDDRLLLAWALTYHELGDDDRAWFLAQRLGEFPTPLGRRFFAHCGANWNSSSHQATGASDGAKSASEVRAVADGLAPTFGPYREMTVPEGRHFGDRVQPLFQCGIRPVELTWRDFLPRR